MPVGFSYSLEASLEGSSLEKLSSFSNVKKYWHLGCLGDHNCKMNSCNFLSPFGSLLQYAFIGIKICCLIPSVTPTLSCIDFSLFNFLLHILTPSFGALLWYVFIVYYYQVSENSANVEIPFVYSCFFWVYSCITWKKILLSSFYPLILEVFFLCRESILIGIRKCRA